MKVLFDEDVPRKLTRFLPPKHEIQTVVSMKWGGIKNGALLKLIEGEGFDVFITGDKNMADQQRLDGRPFTVLTGPLLGRMSIKLPLLLMRRSPVWSRP